MKERSEDDAAGETILALREELQQVAGQRDFIRNWLDDLIEAIDQTLDEPTKVRLLAGCGQGCFRRHQFKQDIAARAEGDLAKLVEAYQATFEIWQAQDGIHIRYGEVSRQCYCPAAQGRAARPADLHCECTRATHQTIFETALGRPFQVKIVESLRRGGKTCHFLVNEVSNETPAAEGPVNEAPGPA